MADRSGKRKLSLSGSVWVPVWVGSGGVTCLQLVAGVFGRLPWVTVAFETVPQCPWVDGYCAWLDDTEAATGDPR